MASITRGTTKLSRRNEVVPIRNIRAQVDRVQGVIRWLDGFMVEGGKFGERVCKPEEMKDCDKLCSGNGEKGRASFEAVFWICVLDYRLGRGICILECSL